MLPYGERVRVHVNLHRQRQGLPHFAVTQRGRVVGYVESCEVEGARPVVQEAGRRRSAEGRRRVYAYVEGVLCEPTEWTAAREVHLNPRRCGGVFALADGTPWQGSALVRFVGGHVECAGADL